MINFVWLLEDNGNLYGWMLVEQPAVSDIPYRRGHGVAVAGMVHGLS